MRSDEAVIGHRIPPDGCLDIIYDRRHGLRAIGTMAKEQRFDFRNDACLTALRFRPSMAGPFLGVSPSELTDGSAPLEDLWSRRARELKSRLDDANSIQEAMRILLGNLPIRDTELQHDGVIERIVTPTVPPRVDYKLTDRGKELVTVMEAMCAWSMKHLGISPKWPRPATVPD